VALADQSQQKLAAGIAVLWPSPGGVIERTRQLIAFGDRVARPGGWHAKQCNTVTLVQHRRLAGSGLNALRRLQGR